MPLNLRVTLHAFDKWVVDFVGPINPLVRRTSTRYIITMTNYLKKWVEVEPIKDCSVDTTTWFLFENIVISFGCPKVLMSNQGNHFLKNTISTLIEEF